MPARHDDTHFPRCEACGDRIGVYERIWVRRPGGAVERSSMLTVEREPGTGSAALFHDGCLAEGPAVP